MLENPSGRGLGGLWLGIEGRGINLALAGGIRMFSAESPAGTTETLTATLDVAANTSIGHGDPAFKGRAQIGDITSATRSPMLNKNVALARIDVTHSTEGAEVEVGKRDGQQLRLPAVITASAQHDPKKIRPQS